MAARRRGDSLYRGDDRLRQALDRQHDVGRILERMQEIGAAAVWIAAVRGGFFQVVTGTEGGSVCGQDDCPHGPVVADRSQFDIESGNQRVG